MNTPLQTGVNAMIAVGLKSKASIWAVAAYVLAGVIACVAVPAHADVNLVFGTYVADKPTATVRRYKPFLNFLAQEMSVLLGEPVTIRMKIARAYQDGIDQLALGKVDFARFGPASYIMAHQQNPDIQIVAMESRKGQKRFMGVIAAHADSPLSTLGDLAGSSFAFGDELSTIGRYLAQAHLLDAGISSADLSGFSYLGRHDLVGEAVGDRRFQAGALKEGTFSKLVKKGVPIRALFEFENVTKPWLAHPKMSDEVVDVMRQVMLSANNEAIVKEVAKNGFLEGTDQDYDFVRIAMERSQAF